MNPLTAATLLLAASALGNAASPAVGPSLKEIKSACYGPQGPQKSCTLLIARSIVANSKACIQTVESDHNDGAGGDPQDDYDSCVSNFCFKQCASNTGCADFCTKKGQGLYGRLASAPPALIQTSDSMDTEAREQAKAHAWLWLRVHAWDRQPQQDELAELKGSDPGSYAIVKALLAKQQMGLLNPRNPSGGLSDEGSHHLSQEGAASLAKMEAKYAKHKAPLDEAEAPRPVERKALYPEAGAVSHNWMNFKPAETDDEIVASLGGSPSSGSLVAESEQMSSSTSAVADDPSPLVASKNIDGMQIPMISWGKANSAVSEAPKPPLAAIAEAKPQTMTEANSQANNYLAPGGIDFSEFMPSAQKAAAPKPKVAMSQAETELGVSLDINSDLPDRPRRVQAKKVAPADPPVVNALTEFDFGAPVDEEKKKVSEAQTNSYMSAVDLQPAAPTKADHVNPYLTMMGADGSEVASRPDASLLSSRAAVSSSSTPAARLLRGTSDQPTNRYLQSIDFGAVRTTRNVYGAYVNDMDN